MIEQTTDETVQASSCAASVSTTASSGAIVR